MYNQSNYIKVAKPIIGDEEIQNVITVLKSGRFVQGPWVEKFEKEYAKYLGVKHAIATNSGTAAEQIILAALGIGPGDEVMVPAITFFSTATAVLHQNAIPTFCDVERRTVTLDPEDFKNKITEKTKAVVPVHLYGGTAEMDKVLEYAYDESIYVIEDAAQAHGAEYKGKKVGTIGDANFWSFYATKNITSGEGGMITTNDDEIAEKARIIRNHGMINRDDHIMLGYNYRMNEIQAAIGVAQVPKLDEWNNTRIMNSIYLLDNLSDIPWIDLPEIRENTKHVFFWCPIFINEEKLGMTTLELRTLLIENGIETRHRYNAPLYKQIMLLNKKAYPRGCPFNCPYYGESIEYAKYNLTNAEEIAGKILGLPNHPELTAPDLDKIISTIKNISLSNDD